MYSDQKGAVHQVAVKQCQEDATKQMKLAFLQEANIMKPFVRSPHPNILRMIGVCFQSEPLLLVVELMDVDLLAALRAHLYPVGLRVRVSVDIASAVAYLGNMKFVHRDLACRNCLVDTALSTVKIADFGLSKDVVMEDYYTLATKTILPVRWMAPESLTRGNFSKASDVWSLGVVMYEVFTHGDRPYASLGNGEVLDFITGGGRLARPVDCPEPVYTQMVACWRMAAGDRPHAHEVHEALTQILSHMDGAIPSGFRGSVTQGGGGLMGTKSVAHPQHKARSAHALAVKGSTVLSVLVPWIQTLPSALDSVMQHSINYERKHSAWVSELVCVHLPGATVLYWCSMHNVAGVEARPDS
jgi:serine/threonine protein kinase